jgi:hypothetical protein
MITAVRSVHILRNCTVNLLADVGELIDGRYKGERVSFQENQPAHRNRPSPKELVWIDNGGERIDSAYKVRLMWAPEKTPDFILIEGILFKVVKSDERPERKYWRYLCIEQFDTDVNDEL